MKDEGGFVNLIGVQLNLAALSRMPRSNRPMMPNPGNYGMIVAKCGIDMN
jgi:hypothetical protein